jgi:hypothetical protein
MGVGLILAIPAIIAMFKLLFWAVVLLISAALAVFVLTIVSELWREYWKAHR